MKKHLFFVVLIFLSIMFSCDGSKKSSINDDSANPDIEDLADDDKEVADQTTDDHADSGSETDDDSTDSNVTTDDDDEVNYKDDDTVMDDGSDDTVDMDDENGDEMSDEDIATIPAPEITKQPEGGSVNEGESFTFTLSAQGEGMIQYQWQIFNGTAFNDIPGAFNSGFTVETTEYYADNNSKYRCRVFNEGGEIFSDEAVLNIIPPAPTITVHPQDTTASDLETVSFSVTAEGKGLSYLWQISNTHGTEWDNIPDSDSDTLSIQVEYPENEYSEFRVIVSNSGGSVTSDEAEIRVYPAKPLITVQPENVSVSEGSDAMFSISATGEGHVTYQWQKKTGDGFVDIGSAFLTSYTVSSTVFEEDNGSVFRCRVYNEGGEVISNEVVLNVIPDPPSVTGPANVSVRDGEQAEFSVAATGKGTFTYQWQRNDSDSGWYDITGADSDIFILEEAWYDSDNGSKFRCVVSNEGGEASSLPEGTLTVYTKWFVKNDAAGDNSGRSWENAFTSLQIALDAARTTPSALLGDDIWVAAGTYKPDYGYGLDIVSDPRLVHFRMKHGVKIYGGFEGTETAVEERDFVQNETILSCDIGVADDVADNCYHVIYHPVGYTSVLNSLLDGFVIEKGNADLDASDHEYGGAIFNRSNYLTVYNTTFRNNKSLGSGGALYNNSINTTTIAGCTFENNTSESASGAFFSSNATLILEDSSFLQNSSVGQAGALYLSLSNATVSNCIFENNTSSGNGAAIYISGSSTTLNKVNFSNCTFDSNYINESASSRNGGAIYNMRADLKIEESLFFNNKAVCTGCLAGAIYSTNNPFTILSSEFDSNRATGNGGALYITGTASATISETVLSNNTSDADGGAVYTNSSTTVAMSDTTFTENNSASEGGALYSNGTLQIENSLFGKNSSITGGAFYLSQGTFNVKNCTINENTSVNGGGAFYVVNTATGSIEGSTFNLNSSTGTGIYGRGGAIYNISDLVSINGSIFSGNTSNTAGGAIFNIGDLKIDRSVFTVNNAVGKGGAIASYPGATESSLSVISNSLFYNNSCGSMGGAIWSANPSTNIIINSTFHGNINNSATYCGGAISNEGNLPVMKIYNSILWNNAAASNSGNQICNDMASTEIYNSDIQDSFDGSSVWVSQTGTDMGGNIDQDPLFTDAGSFDFHLLSTSPCIDSGSSVIFSSYPEPAGKDLDDLPRIAEGDGTPPMEVDMGAYEIQ